MIRDRAAEVATIWARAVGREADETDIQALQDRASDELPSTWCADCVSRNVGRTNTEWLEWLEGRFDLDRQSRKEDPWDLVTYEKDFD